MNTVIPQRMRIYRKVELPRGSLYHVPLDTWISIAGYPLTAIATRSQYWHGGF